MAIIVKKIGNRQYAYSVKREGKKVIHTYLGSTEDPRVKKAIFEHEETNTIPERLHPLFWDTRPENIHMKRNAKYIIERILELGNLDAVNWLQRVFSVKRILDVVNTSRILSEKSRNFWRQWFGGDA